MVNRTVNTSFPRGGYLFTSSRSNWWQLDTLETALYLRLRSGVTTAGGASILAGAVLCAIHCDGLRNMTEHLLQA
jgi:hypothetical protein